MLTPYYARLTSAQVAGAAFSATSAATILPAQAVYTLPAGFLQFIGQEFRIRAAGSITTGANAGSITFNLELAAGTINAWTSGAITYVVSQATPQTWVMDVTFTVRSVGGGTAATLMGIGELDANVAVLANGGAVLPATSPVVGTGFNSTVAQTVDLWAAFSAAGNSLTLQQYSLDACL